MGSRDEQIRGRRNEDNGGINQTAIIQRDLEEQIEKKEEQILKMEASVFQLANYFFVFQGVVLAAIVKGSNSSALKCEHFWLPFAISLIGAILNFCSLFIISYKYKECLDQLDEKTLILYRHFYRTTSEEMNRRHRKKRNWRRAMLAGSMVLFLAFAALNLVGTWLIPCRS